MTLLDEVLERVQKMTPEQKAAIIKETDRVFKDQRWVPSPGPQMDAFMSPAYLTLYGGQGGGGKTDLILGLAFTQHRRTLIVRRRYTDLTALIDRALQINGTRKGYSGQTPPSLNTVNGKFIEFGACANPGDEQHFQGQPHDLLAVDEASQLLESQVRFLMGWVRDAVHKDQRLRVVLATNPPLTSEGQWLFDMFRPWVDPNHHDPAKPGELRWYVTDEDGKDQQVDGPEPTKIGGKTYIPLSRTFIPAALGDNPFLANSAYQATLDALPEPLRSAIRDGNFQAGRRDDLWQLIPSKWVIDAQARWTANPPMDAPMCSIGVDPAQGGTDETILALRYNAWFAPMVAVPGRDTPEGSDVAALVVKHRRSGAIVGIDMGGGYGGAVKQRLEDNQIECRGHKGAEKSTAKSRDGQYSFVNKRSEVYWKFREALDPSQEGGSQVALPPDNALFADLVAPTFEVAANGIKVEPKEDIVERLGRSPDRGDAVVIAWSVGPKVETHGTVWKNLLKVAKQPQVIRAHANRKRRR